MKKFLLTCVDLKYAYSQLKCHTETAKHWGTYRIKTGPSAIINMPAELLKVIDYTPVGLKNTFYLLDDVLIESKINDDAYFK